MSADLELRDHSLADSVNRPPRETPTIVATPTPSHASRLDRVISLIREQKGSDPTAPGPDVFAILEVTGAEVYSTITSQMPEYSFHITEGEHVQNALIGVRSGLQTFFTQKTEYKSGTSALRPGALLTVTKNGDRYPLLFLHTKSFDDPRGFGIRVEQLERAFSFRKPLDAAAQAISGQDRAKYVFLGDLNTMGMKIKFSTADISQAEEIARLARAADDRGMRLLTKTKDVTWWNGKNSPGRSNLDHVIAAKGMSFTDFGGSQVRVIGWPEKATPAQQRNWIGRYSDHAMLYFEIIT